MIRYRMTIVKRYTNLYNTPHNQQYIRRCLDQHKQLQMQEQSCGQFYRRLINNLRDDNYFICQICYKQCQRADLQPLTKCQHSTMFCNKCINIYVRIKLMTYQEIYCPTQNCQAIIDKECIFWKNMSQQLQKRYNKFRASEQKLKDVNFRTCPLSNCEGNIIFKGKVFKCTVCSQQFCLNCLSKVHKGKCDFEDAGMLQKTFNLRRCPKCKFMIQKSAGCNIMICLCKFQFCYQCNAPYTAHHICPRDRNYRVIMYNPQFKQEQKIQSSTQKHAQPNLTIKTYQPIQFIRLFQIVFITAFIIPYFVGLSLIYILRMTLTTISSLAELMISIIAVVILGIWPFTMQLVSKVTGKAKYVLLALYPFTMIIGVVISFKELSSSIMDLLLNIYLRKGRKVWKQLFA